MSWNHASKTGILLSWIIALAVTTGVPAWAGEVGACAQSGKPQSCHAAQ